MNIENQQFSAVEDEGNLLEGADPCSPEQVEKGDVVIALLCLETRLVIRYIFQDSYSPEEDATPRQIINLQVLKDLSADASSDERWELCDKSIEELETRLHGKLSLSALNVLKIMIASAVLDPNDPHLPRQLSTYEPAVVQFDLFPFLIMDLRRFDKLGRLHVSA